MRKQGNSLPYISSSLGVSKASVSLWIRGTTLPKHARKRMRAASARNLSLANQRRREQTNFHLQQAALEAKDLIEKRRITSDIAVLLCSLMYWCEGAKSKNDVQFTFTNADPATVRGFITLLRKSFTLDESKFRVIMHLHEYHDEDTQRRFWSKITSVPDHQFNRTFWKPHTGKSIKPGYPGCIHLRYYDVKVARKISAVARGFLSSISVL